MSGKQPSEQAKWTAERIWAECDVADSRDRAIELYSPIIDAGIAELREVRTALIGELRGAHKQLSKTAKQRDKLLVRCKIASQCQDNQHCPVCQRELKAVIERVEKEKD